jgi:hypothetical protein
MDCTTYIKMALGATLLVGHLRAPAQTLVKNYKIAPVAAVVAPKPLPAKPAPIPPNLPTRHFGFFCRQELRMQQNGLPLQFRLGSADQCNTLEGKPGYR